MLKVQLTEEFESWLDELRDTRARARIAARLKAATMGNLGDWKSLGSALFEMRVDVGQGYRVYFTKREKVVIIVLAGGDKSSQPRDIARARVVLAQLRGAV